MIPILIVLAGTVVAAALTWRFCMRPMLRSHNTTSGASCCQAPAADVQDEIRRTRAELAELRNAAPATGGPTLT
jgi:peptidoglycan/LPS O-acetylase OafA/YrhL